MQGTLPKSSEAYCALEVGHPQELSRFIYPAGVCHQINIINCLPAWNKYLARKRSTHACCLWRLKEGALLRGPFFNMGKTELLGAEDFYSYYSDLLSHVSILLILPAKKFLQKVILALLSPPVKHFISSVFNKEDPRKMLP